MYFSEQFFRHLERFWPIQEFLLSKALARRFLLEYRIYWTRLIQSSSHLEPLLTRNFSQAADDSDSSAGSPIEKDPYYSKRATSASKQDKKSKGPPSPFEVAARAAEINAASKARKQAFVESESSASDFELPTRSTLRKVSSAKNQMDGREKATPKKTLADQMDIDGMYHGFEKDENMWENPQETPSKKQKTGANGGADHKLPTELN
jgi:hypothetical protein